MQTAPDYFPSSTSCDTYACYVNANRSKCVKENEMNVSTYSGQLHILSCWHIFAHENIKFKGFICLPLKSSVLFCLYNALLYWLTHLYLDFHGINVILQEISIVAIIFSHVTTVIKSTVGDNTECNCTVKRQIQINEPALRLRKFM